MADKKSISGCLWGVYMRLDPLLDMIADKVGFPPIFFKHQYVLHY